jgi:formate C-acetyltransferase
MYEYLDNPRKATFLKGLEAICLSNIRYIQRYAALASKLASETTDPAEKARFDRIADCCGNIAVNPPRNYYEAVQWIHFAILFDPAGFSKNPRMGAGRADR